MHPVYVDISEEITTVIERLKESPEKTVALVVPKGASLVQSIVNLKLAKRAAADAGKELVLVTTDKIGRNLAGQIGLATAATIEEAGQPSSAAKQALPGDDAEPNVIDGVKVHRYYDESGKEVPADTAPVDGETLPEPIIPRQILTESPAPDAAITVRPVRQEIPEKPVETPAVVAVPETPEMPVETAPPIVLPPATPAAVAVPASKPKKEIPKNNPARKPLMRRLVPLLVLLVILCVLGAAGASAFYYPKTVVTIAIPSQSWEQPLDVTASIGGTPAAQMISVEADESYTFKATGTKETGAKAEGNATLFNSDSSDTQSVPAGTEINVNGLTFATQAKINVPGARIQNGQVVAGSASVSVVADQPGPASNLSNATGTVPGQKLYAQIVSTIGGTSKLVNVITADDVAAAKTALQAQAKASADAKLVAALKDRTTLFDAKTDQYSFANFNSTIAAGGLADTATATAVETLKRLVVDKTAVLAAAASGVASGQPTGFVYKTTSATIDSWTVSTKDNTITAKTTSKGRKAETVATSTLRESLVGKNEATGTSLLKNAVKDGTISIQRTPGWWPIKNFPYSDKYLDVRVDYE